jgi:multidrug efflux pump
MNLDVTFELGTNLDTAQVLVQNRVSIAQAKLPDEVKRIGVTTKKKSPSILLCVNVISPDARYNQLYLSNFATLNVKDDLARIKGVGDVAFLGPRDYSMRVWIDPSRLASLGMTSGDVIKAIQEQNVQVAAGRIGQPPVPDGATIPFDLPINTQGRLATAEQFEQIIVKTGADGKNVFLKDVVRKPKLDDKGQRTRRQGSSWAPRTTTSTAISERRSSAIPPPRLRSSRCPGPTRSPLLKPSRRRWRI